MVKESVGIEWGVGGGKSRKIKLCGYLADLWGAMLAPQHTPAVLPFPLLSQSRCEASCKVKQS